MSTILDRLVERRQSSTGSLMSRWRRAGLIQQPVRDVRGAWVQVGDQWLLNFTSTDYLGLARHPYVARCVAQATARYGLALSTPRLLAADPLTPILEKELARLVGQDAALIFPSTTHVALDLLPLLAGPNGILFVDAWAYPISWEGVQAAVHQGARVRRFPHNNMKALARLLTEYAHVADKVIVCDGVYSTDGGQANLGIMTELATQYDTKIYVDDAHGLGILGRGATPFMPYGFGGAGTVVHQGVAPAPIVYVSSLSKAFGAPLAFVAGPHNFIKYVSQNAKAHLHSSPPALPVVAAALAALQVHRVEGNSRRTQLLQRVREFRVGMQQVGLSLVGNGYFPIQTFCFTSAKEADALAHALRQAGVWAVLQLQPPDHPQGDVVRFVLTAQHTLKEIEAVVFILYRLAKGDQA